jgi:hypothetical protein
MIRSGIVSAALEARLPKPTIATSARKNNGVGHLIINLYLPFALAPKSTAARQKRPQRRENIAGHLGARRLKFVEISILAQEFKGVIALESLNTENA